MPRIAVVIPVYNDVNHLRLCLEAIGNSSVQPDELIVVDDGSTDGSAAVAQVMGARVVRREVRGGQAAGRNIGVRAATADIILFVDADVRLHRDSIQLARDCLERDPALAAVIGSYDQAPGDPGFVSQYRNLMHSFVHQQAREEASTFWSGCGAVRRDVFLALGGYDEGWQAMEDVEFGYRLRQAGYRIRLERRLQCQHLKRWTLWGMLRADVLDRAIPWTELILRDRSMPNDLNVGVAQRLALLLVFAALVAPLFLPVWISAVLLLPVLAINAAFYLFLDRVRGPWFAVRAIPLHLFYYVYSGLAFGFAAARFYGRKLLRPSVPVSERYWEEIGGRQAASWYLDPVVAAQKKSVHLSLIRRWTANREFSCAWKTDLFEEANGDDDILFDLAGPRTTVIGSDVAFATAARAHERANGSGAQCCVCDVRRSAIRSMSVEMAVSTSTLDHFDTREELEAALGELARVLTPGGMLIITLDNPHNPLYPLLSWCSRSKYAPFRLGQTLTQAELRSALERLGLDVIDEDVLIHNPRMISTALFLALRALFRSHADAPIRMLLRAFAALGALPSRHFTACFIAACAVKRNAPAA